MSEEESKIVPAESELEVATVELTAEDNAVINAAVNTLGPLAMKFGFGGFMGFCSGYAMKKATKVVAVCVGLAFVSLQSLQYCGYIEVRWDNIKKDLVRSIDSDGSGEIGLKDIRHQITRMFNVLRFHGPPAFGFSTGLYAGFLEG